MSILEKFEEQAGSARDQWSLEQWRDAAERLAAMVDTKPARKRGRPPGATDKDNIPALSAMAIEERDAASYRGERITIEESIRRVIEKAARREGLNQGRVRQKLDSAVKQVRTFRASQKNRN